MKQILINGQWKMILPDHRADRPEWLIENGGWEKERLQALHSHITKDDTVFEIGAEEGDMSGLISTWCNGDIVLFEPNPKVWPNIKAIWEANGLKEPMGIVNGFAGNTDDYERFVKDNYFVWSYGSWPDSANGELIGNHGFRHLAEEADVTPTMKIDTFVEITEIIPTVINMDIEGAEWEALKGAEQTLRDHKPKIFVSIHPEFMYHHFKQHANDLRKWIKDLGYNETLLAYDHEVHMMYLPK